MRYFQFPSNNNWALVVKDEMQWAYFDKSANNGVGKYVVPDPVHIVAVLDSVKLAFETFFSNDYVNCFQIPVLRDETGPESIKNPQIIFLNASGYNFAQFIYQFSHELCHIIINDIIEHKFRWFEETVCVLASFFFLRYLSNIWIMDSPLSNLYTSSIDSYKSAIDLFQYYEDRKNESYCLSGQSFASFIKQNLKYFEMDEYNRPIQKLCAGYLLPIFESEPRLWINIISFGEISKCTSFKNFLIEWYKITNYKNPVSQIISLFEYSL